MIVRLPRGQHGLFCYLSFALHRPQLKCTFIPIFVAPFLQAVLPSRSFYTTSLLLKKQKKAFDSYESSISVAKQPRESEDAFDFSTFEAAIAKTIEKLQRDLGALRTGGRLSVNTIEGLKVPISRVGDRKVNEAKKEMIMLSNLCQVVPRGRGIVILVGDREYVKPVTQALLASSHSLNPQPNPSNPTNTQELYLPIPAPTKESRQQASVAAKLAGDMAQMGVKSARQSCQKRLKQMSISKTDDRRKAEKDMEKVAERGVAEVKKIVDGVKKTLEG